MELEIFNYEGMQVRSSVIDNEIWFVGKDICNVLGLTKSGHTLSKIPEEWRRVVKHTTPLAVVEFSCVNESGLYRLIMRSNKPEAVKFQNWICGEVLPAIRKYGAYYARGEEKAPSILPVLDPDWLNNLVSQTVSACLAGSSAIIDLKLKQTDSKIESVETKIKDVDSRLKSLQEDHEKEITIDDWDAIEGVYIRQREIAERWFPGVDSKPVADMLLRAGARRQLVKYVTEAGAFERVPMFVCEDLPGFVDDVHASISFLKETATSYRFTSPLLTKQSFFQISKLKWHGRAKKLWEGHLRKAQIKAIHA